MIRRFVLFPVRVAVAVTCVAAIVAAGLIIPRIQDAADKLRRVRREVGTDDE